MNNLLKKLSSEFLTSPITVICGANETLSEHSLKNLLKFALNQEINKLVFVKPSDATKRILLENCERETYSFIDSIENFKDWERNDLLICGFKPISQSLLKKLKKNKSKSFVYFSYLPDFYFGTWTKLSPFVRVAQISLNEQINNLFPQKPHFSPAPNNIQRNEDEFFFTNRGDQLNQFRLFRGNNKRCCIISGISGIGKRTFLRKLKLIGLNPCIEHICINDLDDFMYILKPLLSKFNISYNNRDIPKTLNPHYPDKILNKLFEAVDKTKVSLIFLDIHRLINNKGNFNDRNNEIFFSHLIKRRTFSKNKIYLITEKDLTFQRVDKNMVSRIFLGAMSSKYIRYILENGFSKAKAYAYNLKINKLEPDEIKAFVGGYPPIANIFVDIALNFTLEDILEKGFAHTKFIDRRTKELTQLLSFSKEEQILLDYICLLRRDFTEDFLNGFDEFSIENLTNLVNRHYVVKMVTTDKVFYYVPDFIKDFLSNRVEDKERKKNHIKIGEYYWESALKCEKNFEQIENFRASLYHFGKADDNRNQETLIKEFSGIFINKAYKFYKEGKIKKAFYFYDILYYQNSLDHRHTNFYLRCCSLLSKKSTKKLFIQSLKKYPNDLFITNSFLNYLFELGKYYDAESEYAKLPTKIKNDYLTKSIYAKILGMTNRKQKAFKILDDEILRLESRPNLRRNEESHLKKTLMTKYYLFSYHSYLANGIEKIMRELGKNNIPTKHISELLKQPLQRDKANEIEVIYERALKSPMAHQTLYKNYSSFLSRQGKKDKANHILNSQSNVIKKFVVNKKNTSKENVKNFSDVIEEVSQSLSNPITNEVEPKVDLKEKCKPEKTISISSPNRTDNGKELNTSKKNKIKEYENKQNKKPFFVKKNELSGKKIKKNESSYNLSSKENIKTELVTNKTTDEMFTLSEKVVTTEARLRDLLKFESRILTKFNKITQYLEKTQKPVEQVLKKEGNNFPALYAKCGLLISLADLDIFKAEVRKVLADLRLKYKNEINILKSKKLLFGKFTENEEKKILIINQNIDKMKVKFEKVENSEITIAKKIKHTIYHENTHLSKEEFVKLKHGLISLDTDNSKKMVEIIQDVEIETDSKKKNTKMEELKTFLLECGIAINQNITASILFEALKPFIL